MSDFAVLINKLLDRIADLEEQTESLRRQVNNIVREGVVTDVDHRKGVARVKSNGLDSPFIPWSQRSGSQQEYDPPAKGERVVVISPTGNPGQGIIFPGGYSDQYPQPYDKEASWFRRIGDSVVLVDRQKVTLAYGPASLKLDAAGIELSIGSSAFRVTPGNISLVAASFTANRA